MGNEVFKGKFNTLDILCKKVFDLKPGFSGIVELEKVLCAEEAGILHTIRNFKNNIISHNQTGMEEPVAPQAYIDFLVGYIRAIEDQKELFIAYHNQNKKVSIDTKKYLDKKEVEEVKKVPEKSKEIKIEQDNNDTDFSKNEVNIIVKNELEKPEVLYIKSSDGLVEFEFAFKKGNGKFVHSLLNKNYYHFNIQYNINKFDAHKCSYFKFEVITRLKENSTNKKVYYVKESEGMLDCNVPFINEFPYVLVKAELKYKLSLFKHKKLTSEEAKANLKV